MARYFKATITGVTGPTYVSLNLKDQLVQYEDPDDDKIKILAHRGKTAEGEVRTELDCSALWGTTTENVAVVFEDPAGTADLTITLPEVGWSEWSGSTGQEDTSPAEFSLKFTAQVPA